MPGDYEYIKYEVDGKGIATITLNRSERMNAFNRQMSGELFLALDRFAHADDEKVLVLTGSGRAFSVGEDLRNINLGASDLEMRQYAKEALYSYHNVIRIILGTGKPIIAMLNGVAAGAGLSIALACDYRLLVGDITPYLHEKKILVPAFADMGLVADGGMTATLPRLIGLSEAQKWCEYPRYGATIARGMNLGVIDHSHLLFSNGILSCAEDLRFIAQLAKGSAVSYAFLKEMRNNALVYTLNKRIFPWEIRAQTACLESNYFKEKARAFLGKPKAVKEKK